MGLRYPTWYRDSLSGKKPPEKCNISGGLSLVAGTEPEPTTFQVMSLTDGLVLLRRDLLEEAA